MSATPDIEKRIDGLWSELEELPSRHKRFGFADRYIAISLMIVTIACSAIAGIGGLLLTPPPKMISGLALLPGVMAFAAGALKFQVTSNWHFRKTEAIDGLLHRLLYELPASPTPDDVAKVSSDLTKAKKEFLEDWVKQFVFSWAHFGRD